MSLLFIYYFPARTFASSAKEKVQKKGGNFFKNPQVAGKTRYLLLLGIPAAYISVASCESNDKYKEGTININY